MSKKIMAIGFALVLVAAFLIYNSDAMKEARLIKALVAQNIEARGGADVWQAVESLRLAGQMDLGQGMHVPYVMEQKRPGKMCLEFVFDGETATQCVDGKSGWKLLPFRGRNEPEAMTEKEFHDMADSAAIDGLLFNAAKLGHDIKWLGTEVVAGRAAFKVQVTLPGGAVRWAYIDKETGLDIKLDSMRVLSGEERRVETFYYDWQETDGLLIPRRQETHTEGKEGSNFLTVDAVLSNPSLDDSRFAMPATAGGGS